MTKFYLLPVLFCSFLTPAWNQKIYPITRLQSVPQLDGVPDDSCWQRIVPTDPFITSTPIFGRPALPGTVRLFYTDEALYVAAVFTGAPPRRDGSQRDVAGLADWFSIGLDTWDDDQNAFRFTVTAAGVQSESRLGSNRTEADWDAVWQSAVTRQADGWSVEIRLPFTALRFPRSAVQHWGLQLSRFDRRSGTLATWSPRQPLIGDEVLQYGALEGLSDLHARQRVSAAIHSRVDHTSTLAGANINRMSQATLGIDGRWGFQSNATLDVALLPGTGVTVKEENCYYCASEARGKWHRNAPLPEPRQLLAEEAPMFEKSGIYRPYVVLQQSNSIFLGPGEYFREYRDSRVWSAAKFSIRLPGNVGVGVYNTVMGPSSMIIDRVSPSGIATQEQRPLTGVSNYTLLTVEKALARNSWVSLSNASVVGRQPFHNNLSALAFQLRDRGNRYQLAGNVQANFPEVDDTLYRGTAQYHFSVGKINGRWTWQLSHARFANLYTDILNADPRRIAPGHSAYSFGELGYHDYSERGWRQNTHFTVQLQKRWLPGDERDPLALNAALVALGRRFQQWRLALNTELQEERRDIHFSNTLHLVRSLSPYSYLTATYQSDDRKRFYYQLRTRAGRHWQGEAADLSGGLTLHWVAGRRVHLYADYEETTLIRQTGALPQLPAPGYYLLRFNTVQSSSSLGANWYCSSGFNLFAAVNLNNVQYHRQQPVQLTADGKLSPAPYGFERLSNYSNPYLEVGGQWVFAPISQLRFQFTYFPGRTITVYSNIPPFIQDVSAHTIRPQISFVYWMEGNKKRRLE